MADFRRWILVFATLVLVLGLVAPASAQQVGSGLICTATASVTPTLRAEGFTELTGDIVLTCVGAPNATPTQAPNYIPQADISVTINGTITSRILAGASPNALTDAVLVVDDPTPAPAGNGNIDPCTNPYVPTVACQVVGDGGKTFNNPAKVNAFQGIQGGPGNVGSSITFLGVPVDPPGSANQVRTYRIANIRVDASGIGAGSGAGGVVPVSALVTSSSSTSLQINNPQLYVGFVQPGLTQTTSPEGGVFFQCQNYPEQIVGSVTFKENFSTAFKTQTQTGGGLQNQPTYVYYSESGLQISFDDPTWSGTTGLADTATELQTTITNIPTGAQIWVDNWAQSTASTGIGTTGYSDATLVGITDPNANTVTLLADNTSGTTPTAQAVWYISNSNSSALDSLTFNIYATFTAQNTNPGVPASATTATNSFWPAASTNPGNAIPYFNSTVNAGTASGALFTLAQCQTILLFPYVTDFYGFDTGIAISNTSMDGLTPTGFGATPQSGTCSVAFFGDGGVASAIGSYVSPGYTAEAGVVASTNGYVGVCFTGEACGLPINGTGIIAPGQTWAWEMGGGTDMGYESVAGYGTTGYAVATCNFQYAHGYSFVSDDGIRNFATAYLALIIPDSTRLPQPFTCSQTGTGTSCSGYTGEQLVH